jgi:DHA2 family methylenomycin A resistance protein-like MFS transporter
MGTVRTSTIPPTRRRGLLLAVMCVGMFLVLLDVTIVNVALPSIRRGLHVDPPDLPWVVDGYAVAIASLLLAGGGLGDRLGHGRTVLVGLALFGLASVGCGSAANLGFLVAARAVQGVGAALLLPGSIAVLATAYPDQAERARALGIWAAVSALSLPAGPALGGLLVVAAGWRAVFFVNLPIVAVALVAIHRLVGWTDRTNPAGGEHVGQGLDVAGALTAAATLAALVFAVLGAGRSGLSLPVLAAAAVALLAGAGFVAAERRAADPLLPLRLFRLPVFAGANAVALAMNLVGNGSIFVITLYLQEVQHRDPLRSGLLLLPVFVPLAVLSPVAGRLAARFGPAPPMIAGLLLGAAGAASLVLVTPTSSYLRLLPALVGLGVGMGLLTAPLVAAAISALRTERSGLASGVNNTARQAGTAAGVAIFGAVVGSTEHAGRFVAGLHWAGLAGAVLWLGAAALTIGTVAAATP